LNWKSGTPVAVLYGEPDVGNTTYNRKRLPWVCLGIEAYSFRGDDVGMFCPSSLTNVTGP